MNKHVLSLVMIFVLLCTMSISVSAASASTVGETSGGTLGIAKTKAELNVYTDHATATTWSGQAQGIILKTELTYFYYNANYQTSRLYATGSSTATAYPGPIPNVPSAIKGESVHRVYCPNGEWGSWTSNLSANVW